MYSAFQEIEKIREGKSFQLNETVSNRYSINCNEPSGIKTAYYFSVPIRNEKTNNVVDLRFHHIKQDSSFIGSEATILVTDKIKLLNKHGQCDIVIQGILSQKNTDSILFTNNMGSIEIRPTLNGILFLFDSNLKLCQPEIKIHLDRLFKTIRTNNKYFSVMKEKNVPFITASCIGVINTNGKVTAPCEVYSRKINDYEYILTFVGLNQSRTPIAVEINMQEPKLFQDTTVESRHPTDNNAFGGISFLGESKEFGEQWLYSRLVFSNLAQPHGEKIIKSILHIPKLGSSNSQIIVNNISERFCSFRSNWENKIPITDLIATSYESNGYYHVDLTNFLVNNQNKPENFVIRRIPSKKPVIIPTGDSFYSPQILEVQYKKNERIN